MNQGLARLLLSAIVALLAVTAVGCGSKVCDDAYDKIMNCVDGLDCKKLGPTERTQCESSKKTYDKYKGEKSAYEAACSVDSDLEREAGKLTTCQLDPRTCKCP